MCKLEKVAISSGVSEVYVSTMSPRVKGSPAIFHHIPVKAAASFNAKIVPKTPTVILMPLDPASIFVPLLCIHGVRPYVSEAPGVNLHEFSLKHSSH
ncbi:hypothetical protein J6590_079455 [Homalodisca vitripennis]|nr:hypothetical protein J6590_079455 [Homalodisca vitripennis]